MVRSTMEASEARTCSLVGDGIADGTDDLGLFTLVVSDSAA